MKKVDNFVLKSFTGPLIVTFFIVLIILILQFLWMYIDELAGKGLEFKVLAELLYHFSMTFVPTALPLAILLASLMTFGNMGEYSELTALKSSGIPLRRIMRPLILLLSIVAVISFFFSNNVLPYSTQKARTLLWDIRRKKPDINIQAGTFYNGIPDFSIKVTSKDPVTNRLDGIIIYDHRERQGNVAVTLADSGYMKSTSDGTGMVMRLFNGYSFTEMKEKNVPASEKSFPSRTDYFKEQEVVISLSGFDLERSQENLFKTNASTLNIATLTHFIDSLNVRYNNRVGDQLKEFNSTKIYHEKINLANIAKSSDPAAKSKFASFEPRVIFDSLKTTEKRTILQRSIDHVKEGSGFLSLNNETLHYEVKNIKKYEIEWNKKLTMSFACLVFFFIGAPLGAIIRKGGFGTPAVISVFFFVIYYVISLSAQKLVEEDLIGTFAGMWAASYILLPIGIFLTWKATTDSSILNVDTYLQIFRKIKDNLYRFSITGLKSDAEKQSNDLQ